MVEVACSHCGRLFPVKPYRLARNTSGRIFCSSECRRDDGTTLGRPRAKLELTCPICGTVFHRKPAELRSVNYCSYRCAGKAKPPPAPREGERRSRGTEFGAVPPHNRLEVGTVRIRSRPGRNDRRAWVKVAEPNVWRPRAVVVWEAAHGPMPAGFIVHHENRDMLDDRLENLTAISRAAHLAEHRSEFGHAAPSVEP